MWFRVWGVGFRVQGLRVAFVIPVLSFRVYD